MTEAVQQATVELFGELGATLRLAGGRPPERGAAVAASIGFLHEAARGTLTLFAPRSGALAFWPAETQIAPTPEAMRDLFGELANLVLGRIKLRLLARGVIILLTTPIAWSGADLEIESGWGGVGAWFIFESDRGSLFVRFDVLMDEGFSIGDRETRAVEVTPGEPILF
jgi:hypothetical protein